MNTVRKVVGPIEDFTQAIELLATLIIQLLFAVLSWKDEVGWGGGRDTFLFDMRICPPIQNKCDPNPRSPRPLIPHSIDSR